MLDRLYARPHQLADLAPPARSLRLGVLVLALTFSSARFSSAQDASVPVDAGPPVDDAASAPLDGGLPVDDAAQHDAGASMDPDAGAPEPPPADDEDPFAELEQEVEAEAVSGDAGVEVIAPDDSLFAVEGIEIVGTLEREAQEAPGSVYVLDEKQLERFNFDDAHQVLVQVPGVYVRQEDGYGLRPNIGMRGADPDRSKKITLMEDGVLFGPAPYSAPAAYYFPVMTRMVGVEVWKGASAIRHGPQTIGGGLDLRTRETPEDGFKLGFDVSGGNTYYNKLHVFTGHGTSRWGVMAEGVHLSTTGFKELDGGGDTGFGKQEMMLKGRFNTDPHGHVYQRTELKLGFAREASNETYLGLTDRDFRRNPLRRYASSQIDGFDYWRTQIEARHLLGVGEHFELETVAYRHDLSRLWNRLEGFAGPSGGIDSGKPSFDTLLSDPGLEDEDLTTEDEYYALLRGETTSDATTSRTYLLRAGNRRKFVSQGMQSVARFDFTTGKVEHEVEVGLRAHHDRIRRRHSAKGFAWVDDADMRRVLEPDGVTRDPLARNEVETVAVSAHAVYDVTFSGLTLSPGMRTEIIRATYREQLDGPDVRFDPNVVLFALGARYALTDAWSLIAGAQQGMTPVAPAGGATGDIEVQVERATNLEAGARYVGALAQGSLIGFVSDYDNVVAPAEAGRGEGQGQSAVSGTAIVSGLELDGHGRIKLPGGYGLPLRGAYTFTRAVFTQTFTSSYKPWARVEVGDTIPFIPPHQFSVSAGVDRQQKIGLDLMLSFMDRMREVAGSGEPLPTERTDRYAMLDAAAYVQALDTLRVYLKCDNVTNNQPLVSRRPFGARPGKPLLVQVGVKWEI
jgi:Fe(3+) dicitrate transport protein